MFRNSLSIDPRWFQVLFQSVFLGYGVFFLHWKADWIHYAVSISGCIGVQFLFDWIHNKQIPSFKKFSHWGFSVLISAMSLCLLLKTNSWQISLLAAFLTVAGKYLIRLRGSHIVNPSALGIVGVLLITDQAWLSPGQWGSSAVIFFMVATLGTIVITRVQRLDVSLAFLLTYTGLLFARQVLYLQWPADFFIHSISTGSLLLFSFFMISDPKTAPLHPLARIGWAVTIGAVSFYLSAFKWMYNTPIWVLVAASPLVPLLNFLFKSRAFEWRPAIVSIYSFPTLKNSVMKRFLKKTAALFLMALLFIQEATAFCGFYVAKADGTLKNKTSQVIIVRDGNRNVITMYNDFKGNFKDFAMVVPVPVVLKQKDIRVVNQSIFDRLNDYSKPRLVEYYDENPCQTRYYSFSEQKSAPVADSESAFRRSLKKEESVKVEAKYIVGEYDILILSATESTGLKDWLRSNGYKIPAGAEEVLDPYIKSNLKFFVVKVNEAEKKKLPGEYLRPIQISFSSPKFMLPIRLGMANADGDQDMIVYAFTKKGRVECTNYRTVELPTGKNIPLFVKDNFGAFYSNLFQHQWNKEGKSISMVEYAWDVSPKNFVKCDPCVAEAPGEQDLVQAGVWWLRRNWNNYDDVYDEDAGTSSNVYFTRLHIRYNRHSFPQDLVFQVTPNTENYQARYIITHPAEGDFTCEAGKRYLRELKQRRKGELEQLVFLTGKNYENWDLAHEENNSQPANNASYAALSATGSDNNDTPGGAWPVTGFIQLFVIGLAGTGLLWSLRRTGSQS